MLGKEPSPRTANGLLEPDSSASPSVLTGGNPQEASPLRGLPRQRPRGHSSRVAPGQCHLRDLLSHEHPPRAGSTSRSWSPHVHSKTWHLGWHSAEAQARHGQRGARDSHCSSQRNGRSRLTGFLKLILHFTGIWLFCCRLNTLQEDTSQKGLCTGIHGNNRMFPSNIHINFSKLLLTVPAKGV